MLYTGNIKRLFVLLVFIGFAWSSAAQTHSISLNNKESGTRLKYESDESIRLSIGIPALDLIEIKTPQGYFTKPRIGEGHYIGLPGHPGLPAMNYLVDMPYGTTPEIIIHSHTIEEIYLSEEARPGHPLYPVQPSRLKKESPDQEEFLFNENAYQKSGFISHEPATIEPLGTLRNINIARLTIAPVSYDPSRGVLQIINNIDIEIRFHGGNKMQEEQIAAQRHSPFFEVLHQQVINPQRQKRFQKAIPELPRVPVRMLLISHPEFRETLAPFIKWQNQKGISVFEAYTNEIGSTAPLIQNFIRNVFYTSTPENPAPTFLVLVGDTEKLPASGIGIDTKQVTDLYYASVDGDYFPDMYYARLSARNNQELKNQIDKILFYQQYQFSDPSFLNDVTLIAGFDHNWSQPILQPTVTYATQNHYNAANGFRNVNQYLSNYLGSYSDSSISVSFINYTGHCLPTAWSDPSLAVANIYQMTNTGRYPLAIGNCCQSALFSHPESLAEAWMRVPERGAVAYIGSAPDTHWFEDFYWSVGAFPIIGNNSGYVPSRAETTMGAYDAAFELDHIPVAAIKVEGNLAITQANIMGYQAHSNVRWYCEGYHTFGDPSTQIYFGQPLPNPVAHIPVFPSGSGSFRIEAYPGSYAALSVNGQLLGVGMVPDNGVVYVPVSQSVNEGVVRIVVTRQGHVPYIHDIAVASLQESYVILDAFSIEDVLGNNNGIAEYGETISLDVTLVNIGQTPSGELIARIEGTDPYVTVLNPEAMVGFPAIGTLPGENRAEIKNAFNLQISHSVPDEHRAIFRVVVSDGQQQWHSDLRLFVFAPQLSGSPDFVIDDTLATNPNGRLDPGETVRLQFEIKNTGSAGTGNFRAKLHANSPYLTIMEDLVEVPDLLPGEARQVSFVVKANASVVGHAMVQLEVRYDKRPETIVSELIIGFAPELQIGNGNVASSHFPFYNLYRANKTQILILSDELGPGKKTIREIGMNLVRLANQYTHLPNFTIRMGYTHASSINESYLSLSNPKTVFSSESFAMPSQTGWYTWQIDPFEYKGTDNLVIEIIWGRTGGWTQVFYQVASTPNPGKLDGYGYSDLLNVPDFSGSSNLRPNIRFGFISPLPAPEQQVLFYVRTPQGVPVNRIDLRVGSLVATTNTNGLARFDLLPGQYAYDAFSSGIRFLSNQLFEVSSSAKTIEIVVDGFFDVRFFVRNIYDQEVQDAVISLYGNKLGEGVYEIRNLPPGIYSYAVSRQNYFDYHGTFTISNANLDIPITLIPDNTGVPQTEMIPPISVYPNPASNYVVTEVYAAAGLITWKILNQAGQLMISRVTDHGGGKASMKFQLEHLPAGLYFIQTSSREGTRVNKLIIGN